MISADGLPCTTSSVTVSSLWRASAASLASSALAYPEISWKTSAIGTGKRSLA
jgi:hypothetical protein